MHKRRRQWTRVGSPQSRRIAAETTTTHGMNIRLEAMNFPSRRTMIITSTANNGKNTQPQVII